MKPGKFNFYKCPNCGHHFFKSGFSGGNSLEAFMYSDGKVKGPMLSTQPIITSCKKCNAIIWLNKSTPIAFCYLEQIEDIHLDDDDYADFLSIEENFTALSTGMAETPEEEMYIRKRLWWAYHDRVRIKRPLFTSNDDEEKYRNNILKLLALIVPDDTDKKFMKAELYRNLGDFESCLQMIETIEAGESDNLKGDFIDACANKNKNLFIFSMYIKYVPKWQVL